MAGEFYYISIARTITLWQFVQKKCCTVCKMCQYNLESNLGTIRDNINSKCLNEFPTTCYFLLQLFRFRNAIFVISFPGGITLRAVVSCLKQWNNLCISLSVILRSHLLAKILFDACLIVCLVVLSEELYPWQ